MTGNNFSTLLTSNVSAAGTTLAIASTAGWQAGDTVVIASTTQTASQCEARTIASVDSAAQVTVAGVTNAHSGTSPTQAEVVNISHNIKIRGISATNNSYISCNAQSRVVVRYSEFSNLGSSTSLKKGIDVATTTGGFDFQYSSIHDCTNNGPAVPLNITSTSGNNIQVQHCAFYNNFRSVIVNVATSGVQVFNDLVCILSNDSGVSAYTVFAFADAGSTYTNITVVGQQGSSSGNIGISIAEGGITGTNALGVCSGLTAHACSSSGLSIGCVGGTIANVTVWRCNVNASANGAIQINSISVLYDTVTAFGNSTANIVLMTTSGGNTLKRLVLSGDTTFATANGIKLGSAATIVTLGNTYVEDSTFGVATGIQVAHSTADINTFFDVNTAAFIFCRNCLFASSTEFVAPTATISSNDYNWLFSQRHDQTAGNYKAFGIGGNLLSDTTIFRTAAPSLRLTPTLSGKGLTVGPQGYGFLVPINSGASVNGNVWVRKSVSGDGTAYNGSQPQLVLRRNTPLGFASDTVLASGNPTVTGGQWEYLAGDTPIATDNGICEFTVLVTGGNVPSGWVNLDDFRNDGLRYWGDGVPHNQVNNENIIFSFS